MNQVRAEIIDIKTSGSISLISLSCEGDCFTSLIISNEEEYISKGNTVMMGFKETEVSIGKDLRGGLSLRNRFRSEIISIEKGELLSQLLLDYKGNSIVSIITTAACSELQLVSGDIVEALVKTNELMIIKA